MKKSIFTILTLSLMFSCYQGPTVEFDDEKSQAVAAIFDAYMANDMQSIACYSFMIIGFLELFTSNKNLPFISR